MQGKKIILGITGSIAAYKSASLARLLIKAGAEVKVVMTPDAQNFITPVTLSALTQNTVLSTPFEAASGQWNSHVELGLWADIFVIAPCTANTIAKMTVGICDNLLMATYLSMRGKTIIAPAMDMDMYAHVTTRRNIATLQSDGVLVIEPSVGELASGLEGKGRMEDPEKIVDFCMNYFNDSHLLEKKKYS